METQNLGKTIYLNGNCLNSIFYRGRIRFCIILTIGCLLLVLNQSCVSFRLERYTKPESFSTKLPSLKQLRVTLSPELAYGDLRYDLYLGSNQDANSKGIFKKLNKSKKDIINEVNKEYSKLDMNVVTTNLFSEQNKVNPISLNAITTDVINKNLKNTPITIQSTNVKYYGNFYERTIETHTESDILSSSYIKFHYQLYRGKFIDDIDNIFQNKTNGIMESGDNKGYIVYNIVNLKRKTAWPWIVFSSLTVYSINFIGFPIMQQKSDLTLEVTIYDKNWRKIKSYESTMKKSAYSAMYWGYSMMNSFPKDNPGPIQRAANAKAFSSALSDIIGHINEDSSFINNELMKSK